MAHRRSVGPAVPVAQLPQYPGGGNTNPLPQPGPRQPESRAQQQVITVKAAGARTPAIWGENLQTGGMMWGPWVVSGNRLLVLYEVCHGPIGAMDFTLDGKTSAYWVGTGLVAKEVFLGTAAQSVSSLMSTYLPGWSSSLPGKAYVVVLVTPPTTSNQQAPNVLNFLAQISQGLLVQDPRLGVDGSGNPNQPRVFRAAPALVWADFKTSRRYGLGEPNSAVNWAAVSTAANDAEVVLADGSQRYRMGYRLDPSQSLNPDDVVNQIRQHGFMSEAYYNGQWFVWTNKAQAPSGLTFTENNIVDAWWRQKGRSEVPSRVRVNFIEFGVNYQDNAAETSDQGIATNTVEDILYEYNIGCGIYARGKRLSIQFWNVGQLDKEYWMMVGPEAMAAVPGIVVNVTSAQINVSNETMIVKDITCYGSTFLVHMELYRAATYDDTSQAYSPSSPPAPTSPYDAPPEATGISFNPASPHYLSVQDHVVMSFVQPATQYYSCLEIYIEFSSNGGVSYGTQALWASSIVTSPYTLPAFPNGAGLYRLTVKTVNSKDVRSPGTQLSYTVQPASFGGGTTWSGMIEIGVANSGEPAGIAMNSKPTITDEARVFGFNFGGNQTLNLCTNVLWNGSGWNRDDVSKPVWLIDFNTISDYLGFYRAAPAANPVSNYTLFFVLNNIGQAGVGGQPNTTASQNVLQLVGAPNLDKAIGFGINTAANNTLVTIGHAGALFGAGAAYINAKSDSTSVAPNPSIRFMTASIERMRVDNNGFFTPATQTTYDLGTDALRWRTLYLSELRVETLVAQKTIATIGGRILVGPTCKLAVDLLAAGTTMTVDNNQMVSGDRVYMESAPGGAQQIEYFAVTSGAVANGANWDYTVTRNLDATGANDWKAGDAVFNTGQAGNGFIDLYSVRGTKSSSEIGPTIVGNIRNSSTFNDWTPRWAIGNLNGLYGYVATTYGCAFGVPTGAWVKIDPTNGVRLGFNTTTNVQIDSSGNASFSGAITASSGTIGGWTIGASDLVGSGSVAIRVGQSGYNSGTGFFLGVVGGGSRFSLGNSGSNFITWDGSDIVVQSSTVRMNAGLGVQVQSSTTGFVISDNTWTTLAFFGSDSSNATLRGPQNSTQIQIGAGVFNFSSGTSVQIQIGGTKVIGSRGSAVAHATNATDVITQLNALIDRLSAAGGHGLIA